MNNIFGIIIFLILLCNSFIIEAQSNFAKNLSIRADAHYGFILPEYSHFNLLVKKPVSGFELNLTKKTTGKTDWEQIYKYPEYGLTFFYTTLGNKDVFGNECALFPYVKTFLIRKDKFQLTNQFGVGIGFSTKKFDLETNFENISIGSHLNVHFNYKFGTQWKLSSRFSVNSGLSFSHFSNANMAEPNIGINILTIYAGINYSISSPPEFTKTEIVKHITKHEFAFIYAAGGKHARALQSTIYFTSSISAEYKYHRKRKFHFGGGLDLFYDSSTKVEMNATSESNFKTIYDYRSGIHASQELVFDRFSFILQEGFYLGLIDHVNHSLIYNRAILRWKFNDHILMSVSMKSHLHILEYPELSIGYFFISKK